MDYTDENKNSRNNLQTEKFPLNVNKESKLPVYFLILYFFQAERILIVEIKGGPYMKLKISLLLLILTFIFVITGLGFTYFKQNKTTPSKHNVTKENWLNDPYLRWSYTHMKEFTLVNDVKQS